MSIREVVGIIMGGGQGTRLFPLTKDRAKPAVPLAGKYRLIDIPISNCINSNIKKIFVLTQFNSESLHRHINITYRFDIFSGGFVEILAAEQTTESTEWYQGTADAVRHNLKHIKNIPFSYAVILSGDQLYQLNLQDLVQKHLQNNADITVACTTVDRESAKSFGIMKINQKSKICEFVEKPKDEKILDNYFISNETLITHNIKPIGKNYLASMGIYVFNRNTLFEVLNNEMTDFGKEIIPDSIKKYDVYAYLFQGYWEDIGTIKAFFQANLDLVSILPKFNFFSRKSPVYTHPRFLPPTKIHNSYINNTICSEGSLIENSTINNSIIGIRSVIRKNCKINRAIIMGADYFDFDDNNKNQYPLGIGENSIIENAIIDKNSRIGKNVVIKNINNVENYDGPNYYIRDNIVIITKNSVIPDNTII
ncbi:MAG TPA: glucose-1-phosphate adenylyltransferase [bacterium]|nr:glucose-1-phosphate adenylyltransferase [bacterium]HOL48525.1 glucose-1-phosphate adenylyltransferase [bacterium]HPQ19699.1 glucose-1-phosphate adenylyltransferase [bacterium]